MQIVKAFMQSYLEDFGMELRDEERSKAYRLLDRDFEPSEIKLILDRAVSFRA